MNTGFYKDLDTNFEQACEMIEKKFSHDELINLLKTGNIPQKQLAALELDGVYSREDAEALVCNLTGCDGKIREAAALRISQILNESPETINYFKIHPKIFADASIDINGNICRLITECVSILKQDSGFSCKYIDRILHFINSAFEELDKFIYKDKKYMINKQLFKLYWCLEDLKLFVDIIDMEQLFEILSKACEIKEYTIREKTAKILIKLDDIKFSPLKDKLLRDDNYYVREVFQQNSKSS